MDGALHRGSLRRHDIRLASSETSLDTAENLSWACSSDAIDILQVEFDARYAISEMRESRVEFSIEGLFHGSVDRDLVAAVDLNFHTRILTKRCDRAY